MSESQHESESSRASGDAARAAYSKGALMVQNRSLDSGSKHVPTANISDSAIHFGPTDSPATPSGPSANREVPRTSSDGHADALNRDIKAGINGTPENQTNPPPSNKIENLIRPVPSSDGSGKPVASPVTHPSHASEKSTDNADGSSDPFAPHKSQENN